MGPVLYRIFITVHSGLRWVLLALLLTVIVQAVRSWRSAAPFEKKHRILVAATVGMADLQLLLGLGLYFGLTDRFKTLIADPGNVMRTSELRFFAVEHIFGMLLALALLHVTSVRAKRAEDHTTAWKRIMIGFIVALLIIAASIPWPFMPASRPWLRFG